MAIETKIDLSKIPAKETASKIIKVDLDGTGEKEYRIHALDDAQRNCIGYLTMDSKDVMKAREFHVLLLASGLDVCEEDQFIARYLLRNRNNEALFVASEIYNLTQEFYKAKNDEAIEAEKNSETMEETTEASENETEA